ncbi:hypothetical protein HID58_037420 [Brassica napus]|uniref:Uncharacterized protein n=2 Tax=Brassica napus TaxID=3708 RepID=A0ABQ8BLA0_BRANA|nr:hypothetical protein HID58_037420 [Brassica napus]
MEKNAIRILDEIKSSDLMENRVQLLTRLGQLDPQDNPDVPSFVESLTTLWEDFTCLDVSQCLLNKAILPVASKYLALDRPDCCHYFLAFGIKVSQWCAKHLNMSVMSMEESQEEEHSNVFFQVGDFSLLLDYLGFSASSFTAIGKICFMRDETAAVTVRKFVSEQLILTKEVILNAKCVALLSSVNSFHFNLGQKVESFSSEIFKAAHVVIDSVVPTGKTIIWESMFSALLLSLKALMITLSSSPAWEELETFLLQNLLHPHFLCWQIVMELWCFWVRHATEDVMANMIDKLCVFMMSISTSETPLCPDSVLRRTAKSICLLLTHSHKSLTARVYKNISTESRSESASDAYLALLLEGFPLNFLPDQTKNDAKRQIVADFFHFIENFSEKPSESSRYTVHGAPVYALSACLGILKTSMPEIDSKTLKFAIALVQKLRNSKDEMTRDRYTEILSETLSIISRSEQLYTCQEMDSVITELQRLLISETDKHHHHLYKSEPSLALFLSGLINYEMSETETCPKSRGVWELYHLLLRKRHWALVHHAVTAFGYFCARTSCSQLWRFVPEDDALAFDIGSGKEAKTERFMSELKMFLEKEQALLSTTPSQEELELLSKEGMEVKATVEKLLKERKKQRLVEAEKRPNKRRKLPEGICRGVELLQNGMKRINEGLSELGSDESEEFQKSLLNQFSCLEDLVSHLVSLAASD